MTDAEFATYIATFPTGPLKLKLKRERAAANPAKAAENAAAAAKARGAANNARVNASARVAIEKKFERTKLSSNQAVENAIKRAKAQHNQVNNEGNFNENAVKSLAEATSKSGPRKNRKSRKIRRNRS